MKFLFPYREDPEVSRSPAAPDQPVARPKIPIRLLGPDGRDALTFGLLDTGADETIVPHDFAETLGVELGPGTTDLVAGNHQRIRVRYGTIELAISSGGSTYRWQSVVGFQKGRTYSVIGFAGCLDRLAVRFDGPNRRIVIEAPDPPVGETGSSVPSGRAKEIVLEFTGGFKDGERLSSRSPDPVEAQFAVGHYAFTYNGEVGRRFRTYSEAGLQELLEMETEMDEAGQLRARRPPRFDMNQVYEVVERIEDDATITVRFQFMGLSDQLPPRDS